MGGGSEMGPRDRDIPTAPDVIDRGCCVVPVPFSDGCNNGRVIDFIAGPGSCGILTPAEDGLQKDKQADRVVHYLDTVHK